MRTPLATQIPNPQNSQVEAPIMKVIITGGGGFLGHQLCEKLLQVRQLVNSSGVSVPIERVVLLDSHFSRPDTRVAQDSSIRVERVVGSVEDRRIIDEVLSGRPDTSIFHLASMVSGECEERFDDALRVNLQGGLNIFEAARKLGPTCRVVFASSIACFGGQAMSDPCTDMTKTTPQTTYGMTKVMCELLINDYSRKGFFDGRSARLPTVIVRPGKPNAAASSWASGMFREPLHGVDCLLPVHLDQCHPMTGYRTVIDSLVALHDLPAERLGSDRAVGLAALRVTPRAAQQALAQKDIPGLPKQLGKIVEVPDARIQGIVDRWPLSIDGSRAISLGLPSPTSLVQIIREYIEDFIG
jgi:nucleoside-diphosphate-sugar epimerase